MEKTAKIVTFLSLAGVVGILLLIGVTQGGEEVQHFIQDSWFTLRFIGQNIHLIF